MVCVRTCLCSSTGNMLSGLDALWDLSHVLQCLLLVFDGK